MTYDEAIKVSNELRTRYNNGAFSVQDRERIRRLYKEVLRREMKVTNCTRCYHDALIEVVLYLRKEGKLKEDTQYALRAGFIIKCPTFHDGKIFTNDNLTDEIAAEYLSIFPNKRPMFSRVAEQGVSAASVPMKGDETINVKPKGEKAGKSKKRKK